MKTWCDGPVTVYLGDALQVLREMPSGSVHCVVTSPPYWGLRDYKVEPVAWRLGRRSIGVELQPDYLPLIQKRVEAAAMPILESVPNGSAPEPQLGLFEAVP